MKNIVKLLPFALSLWLISCAGIQNGTVVGKRSRPPEPGFYKLGDVFVLEVEKPGPNGSRVLKNLLVSEKEWSHYQIGDRYSSAPAIPKKTTPPETGKKAAQPAKASPATAVKKIQPKKKAAVKPSPSPRHSPAPKPSPQPSVSPKPAKPQPTATPQPTAAPVLSPTPAKPEPTATPQSSLPAGSLKPLPTPLASPKPAAKSPATPTPSPSLKTSPLKVPAPAPSPTPKPMIAATPAPKPQPPLSRVDRALLDEARTQALEDARVRVLKDKIHAARSDEEQRQAAAEYERALYSRMRQIAPQLAPKINRAESDALKNP